MSSARGESLGSFSRREVRDAEDAGDEALPHLSTVEAGLRSYGRAVAAAIARNERLCYYNRIERSLSNPNDYGSSSSESTASRLDRVQQ